MIELPLAIILWIVAIVMSLGALPLVVLLVAFGLGWVAGFFNGRK